MSVVSLFMILCCIKLQFLKNAAQNSHISMYFILAPMMIKIYECECGGWQILNALDLCHGI